jgi:transcriptional regulator with XRE-family HTH domain
MKFAQYLTYLREESGLTKKDLASQLECTPSYISNLEREVNRPPDFIFCEKMANILTKDESKKKKLLELAYDGRMSISEFSFQQALRNKAFSSLAGTELQPLGIKMSDEYPVLLWTDLLKTSNLASFTKRGDGMIRVKVMGTAGAPEFADGDLLVVKVKSTLEDGKYHVFLDGKSAVIKKVEKYGDTVILRSTDLEHAQTFDLKQFKPIGQIISHTRTL